MKPPKIIKIIIEMLKKINTTDYNIPRYRVVEVFKDEEENYKTVLQVINKNLTFCAKPEEILADDNFVDSLSPRDVRTLTYLGYLSLNQPQYKILAQRLSETSETFVVKKRGEKKPIIKTVSEIVKETTIINQMDATDAKNIGYAIANAEFRLEKAEKNEIRSNLEKK